MFSLLRVATLPGACKGLTFWQCLQKFKGVPGGGGGGGDETSIYKENLKTFTVFYNFRAGV